tara:strand:+ start:204 stop:422 length:219 start_codon:yes stop_codon:yes gene_type:complete
MKKILKTSLSIVTLGILPFLIGIILSGLGIMEIGSGLGLALFMYASVVLSILYIISGSIIIGIKKIINQNKK